MEAYVRGSALDRGNRRQQGLQVIRFPGYKARAAGQVKGQGLRPGDSRGRGNVAYRVRMGWEKLLLPCPACPVHARPTAGLFTFSLSVTPSRWLLPAPLSREGAGAVQAHTGRWL